MIGAGLALERGRGDKALPVRPALVSAVAAVLGLVGAFGLLGGIDDALARRERSGQLRDADLLPDEEHPTAQVLKVVMGDERIREVSRVELSDVQFDGHSVPIYTLEPLKGTPSFTAVWLSPLASLGTFGRIVSTRASAA